MTLDCGSSPTQHRKVGPSNHTHEPRSSSFTTPFKNNEQRTGASVKP